MSWGWAEASFLYTLPKAVALQGPLDLGKCAGLFSPPSTNPHAFWNSPSYLTRFLSPWSEDSLVLVPAVVRGRPNNEPNYRTFSLAYLRLYKSYTGVVYICASRSAPSNVLNLIFNARLARFKGRFNPCNQNLQQKNARAQS